VARKAGASAGPDPAGGQRSDASAPKAREGETRDQRNERRRRERELERVGKDIEARESRMSALETALADPGVYHDGARAKELVGEYERLRAEVESLWQRLSEL
jgi:hypothetical protein